VLADKANTLSSMSRAIDFLHALTHDAPRS